MSISIIFLTLVTLSVSQPWQGLGPDSLGHVIDHSRERQLTPLWTPSSPVTHDSWPSRSGQGLSDLERHLSFTGPMVFPPGHEGMFHIPPAPHHLPMPVHSLPRGNARTPSVPQVVERLDEGHIPTSPEWTRAADVHHWNSPPQGWSIWQNNVPL